MKSFSGKFISLMENMKSDSSSENLVEKRDKTGTFRDREKTAAGKSSEREKRREERRGENFLTGNEMNLKSFLRSLESLKSQIVAENSGVYNSVNNKSEGSKYGLPIMRGLEATLKNVLDLIASVTSKMSREGNFLDMTKNSADMESYRTLYKKAQEDYAKYAEEWIEATRKDRSERPIDNKNKEIEASITSATTFFNKAKELFIKNSTIFASKVTGSSSTSTSTASTPGAASISSTIKQRDAEYTGADGDIVKEVKKLIYDKFNKYTQFTSSPDWKAVYKKYPTVSGTLRKNTANVIIAAKIALSGDYKDLEGDKVGTITPNFYKFLKASLNENKLTGTGKIASFEFFMKNRTNEELNLDGASTFLKSPSSSSSSSKSSGSGKLKVVKPTYSATPFKTKEEGNKFREWVNKNHPDWAKSNSLDATGPQDNTYIRKAYAEYGDAYSKDKTVTVKPEIKKMTGVEMNALKAKIEGLTSKSGKKITVKIVLTTDAGEPAIYYGYWNGNASSYGHFYNNKRVTFKSTSGKKYMGTYNSSTDKIVMDGSKKSVSLKDLVTFSSVDLTGETASTSQGKKAYVAKGGDGYVNVRSSAMANTGAVNNLIYKHTSKNPIGLVISSTVTKSSKIGDKTWYKVQFPEKRGSMEYGYVRADTVDVK